jgi:site-specific DNA-methyltransferase (adenine-specific)
MQKIYKIKIQDREIEIIQDIDGKFIKPEIVNELEKFGTATKPAHEPICLARKPLSEKSVAENCLKWGTGGINIDESRVGTEKISVHGYQGQGIYGVGGKASYTKKENGADTRPTYTEATGRFPANLIHDGSEEVRECFPETGKSTGGRIGNKGSALNMMGQDYEAGDPGYGDSGNASRFFKSIIYQAKASKSERNTGLDVIEDKNKRPQGEAFGDGSAITEHSERKGNFHPTVKPITLMEYLIKMITPKGGIVLDPFAGSGSTLVAAKKNGYQYIGIELTEEYIPIIEARLSAVKEELKLF